MDERFSRSERVFGASALEKLRTSSVILFGLGGVGGAACEALVRGGVGKITVVDKDTVDITNLNRQLVATENTVGMKKTDAAEKRAKSINPDVEFIKKDLFYLPENADEIDLAQYDFIIDAIDNVSAKIELAVRAQNAGVPIISSMGTGNKVHPELLKIADIYKTSVCPLARVMRRELKARGVKHLAVVYSEEEPVKTESRTPGSTSFVPPAAGYIAAGYVIRKLLNID